MYSRSHNRIVQKGHAVLRVIRWMSFSKASPSTVFSSTCDSESLRSHSRQIGVAKELSTFYEPCSCCVIGSRTIIYGHRKKVFPFFSAVEEIMAIYREGHLLRIEKEMSVLLRISENKHWCTRNKSKLILTQYTHFCLNRNFHFRLRITPQNPSRF